MINRIKKYFQGVQSEAKRVTWPSKKEVRSHTLIVIGTIIVVMLVFGLIDLGFSKLLEIALR